MHAVALNLYSSNGIDSGQQASKQATLYSNQKGLLYIRREEGRREKERGPLTFSRLLGKTKVAKTEEGRGNIEFLRRCPFVYILLLIGTFCVVLRNTRFI